MKELKTILRRHACRYPGMLPADAVKLIYQNEFGGGHLIRDEQAVREHLRQEYASIQEDYTLQRYEPIGNGLVRVHLAALEEAELDSLAEEFIRSAAIHRGSQPRFLQKLEVLRELTQDGIFAFNSASLERYLQDYAAAGYPMVSHSDAYRAVYCPAYRLVQVPDAFTLATAAIDDLLRRNGQGIVAIDGRCGAGKTSLAARLQARYGCAVIPADHFFLRPEQRTNQRQAIPGENVDHERLLAEVLLLLKQGKPFAYRPFDCYRMELAEPIPVNPGKITIVEGSYACHPELWDHYDLRIFITVDPEEQMRRIAARNGSYARVFREKWIPLEEAYFSTFDLASRCDVLLST